LIECCQCTCVRTVFLQVTNTRRNFDLVKVLMMMMDAH